MDETRVDNHTSQNLCNEMYLHRISLPSQDIFTRGNKFKFKERNQGIAFYECFLKRRTNIFPYVRWKKPAFKFQRDNCF